jgi:cytochrome P450
MTTPAFADPHTADPATVDLDRVDLSDPGWFHDGPPLALFARMREQSPLIWNNSAHTDDFWSVVGGVEITEASKNIKRFSTYKGGIWLTKDTVGPLEMMQNVVLFKDPPDHIKYRNIFQAGFTPNRVARMEDDIRRWVIDLLDEACARGEMDVVPDLAIKIPLMAIASLFGSPFSDLDKLCDWTDRIADGVAEYTPYGDAFTSLIEMTQYFSGLLPGLSGDSETLIGALYAAEVDGVKLTDEEIMMFLGILLFGGNDTTRNAISNGLRLFAEHPDQFATLATDPGLIPNAIEEILRMTTPLNYMARTATEDTELGGVAVSEGQRLALWYPSGSRDERIFPDPERFDVTRRPVNHHAFGGGGRHFCLGAPLARLELRVVLEEVVRRIDAPTLSGPVERHSSIWVNGLASVPITFTPKAA